jgi:hypothetical protein
MGLGDEETKTEFGGQELEMMDIVEEDRDILKGMEYSEILNIIRKDVFHSGTEWEPPQVEPESRVWRYIGVTQLLSILENDSLWFANISSFEDPYEGTVPEGKIEDEIQIISRELNISEETANKIHNMFTARPEMWGYDIKSMDTMTAEIFEIPVTYYVNCWHLNSHESAAFWEQYIGTSHGVAISTTVQKLKSSIQTEDDVVFGAVDYINFKKESIPQGLLPMIYHKRKSFEHESEFRVCIEGNEDSNGNYVDINVGELIDELYLSPFSPGWYKDLIYKILKTYDVRCDLKTSDLYSDSVY